MKNLLKNLFKSNVVEVDSPNLTFYSQYSQDKWLYENLFSGRGGTFIEVGADDGIDKSNTYFFESQLGWNGLCIEPSPSRFKLLEKNRRCHCEEVAIANSHSVVEFMDISGWGKGLSGIVENYDARHVERIKRELDHPDNTGNQVVSVNTIPLHELLEKYGIDKVNFCTIDTEGSELEVLKSINFERCTISVILVENNYDDKVVADYLRQKGYRLLTRVGIDDVFVDANFDVQESKFIHD